MLSVESPLWLPPVSSQSGNQKGIYNHCRWMLSSGYYRPSRGLFAVLQSYNLTMVKRLNLVYRKRNVKSCASSYLHRYVSEFKDVFHSWWWISLLSGMRKMSCRTTTFSNYTTFKRKQACCRRCRLSSSTRYVVRNWRVLRILQNCHFCDRSVQTILTLIGNKPALDIYGETLSPRMHNNCWH
jgi:hypothetical protein